MQHYPGEPKPSYISPWDETPEWERESAAAVYDQVRAFIETTDGGTAKLTRSQKGRFVALCWIGQIFKTLPRPKASLCGRPRRPASLAAGNRRGHFRAHRAGHLASAGRPQLGRCVIAV